MAIRAQASKQTTKITVQQSNKNSSIELGQSNQNLPIELGQSAQHYNNLAKQWATSPNIVENQDYSSKYYAEISKQKTQEITEQIESGKVVLDELKETKTSSIQELNNQLNTCITSIREENNECMNNIFVTSDEAIVQLTSVKTNSIDEIDVVKNSSIDEIENTSAKEQEELTKIKDEAIQVKEELIQGGMFKFQLFDTKTTDRILSYEETFGWALQGTYVYSTAIVGERYGYPTFIERCKKEKSEATATSVTLGSNTLTIYKHSNGHQFYNIADKSKVDAFYNTYGVADYYGVDEANECVFLPRNKWFIQIANSTANVNKFTDAGLPNITGTFALGDVSDTYTAYTNHLQYGDGAFYSNTQSTASYNEGGQSTKGNIPKFDASRSNATYGKSSTVQPKSSSKLLYYCVGNTKADTSWINLVEQVNAGVKEIEDKRASSVSDVETLRINSLQEINATKITNLNQIKDLTLEGIHTLTGASNALNRNQIANCLIEVPQRIKLELADGTLTLKAGSQVIIPYGTSAPTMQIGDTLKGGRIVDISWDEAKLFYIVQYDTDLTTKQTTTAMNDQLGVLIDNRGYLVALWFKTNITYDGTTNVVNGNYSSLPFAICSQISGVTTSIDYTFNGMGYVGSTIWVDKGVKFLSPNGRNKDGSLNNVEGETSSIYTETLSSTYNRVDSYINVRPNSNVLDFPKLIRNEQTNKNYYSNGSATPRVSIGSFSGVNGKITDFKPYQPFRAVDYSSLEEVHVVVETYSNRYSWYRVWSDGWCEQGGMTTASTSNTKTVTLLKPYKDIYYTVVFGNSYTTTATATSSVSTAVKATTGFSIIDSATNTFYTYWQTSGYMG